MPMTREECIDIYKRYSRKLFNVSLRIVGDSGEAEEIMQDTVLKFFQQEMDDQERDEGLRQEGKIVSGRRSTRFGGGKGRGCSLRNMSP